MRSKRLESCKLTLGSADYVVSTCQGSRRMANGTVCPDCPATRNGVLQELVSNRDRPCAFRCVAIGARQPLPSGWSRGYSLALVRRGAVIRQRIDKSGVATAVDAVGPGAATPLSAGSEDGCEGYTTEDTLICICPTPTLSSAVDAGAPTSGQIVDLYRAVLDRVERMAQARARSSALSAVAAALCALSDTLSPPRRLDVIPSMLQQRDLAALLAMRHESVCRALRVLSDRGAIFRSPDGTRIVDRGLLETIE